MRSGSEPDSDASEHRSSDASASLGEPLDPSSKFINEDVQVGGVAAALRPHHRKKKDKKIKPRNLKRVSKKPGRPNSQDEGYSEEGDGESEDHRGKAISDLIEEAEEHNSTTGQSNDLTISTDQPEKAKSESSKQSGEVQRMEEEEEDLSDSWRYQKDSGEESSESEAGEKSAFEKLVEEGNNSGDSVKTHQTVEADDPFSSLRSQLQGLDLEGLDIYSVKTHQTVEADDPISSLRSQLQGLVLEGLDTYSASSHDSDALSSLQDQLKGLEGFGDCDPLSQKERIDVGRTAESKSQVKEGSEKSKGQTSKRRSLLDVFDNYEGNTTACRQPSTTPSERGDGVLRGVAASEDINVMGLRRAKKTPINMGSTRGNRKSLKPHYDMEDAHTVIYPFFGDKGSALLAILDGHAGFSAAREGAKLIPQELKDQLEQTGLPVDHNLKEIFSRTFQSVDDKLKEHEFQGATATVVFVWSDQGKRYLQAANVGDSAAYLRRGNQTVKLTYDHKVTDQGERERLLQMGNELSPTATRINGLAVSRALGDHFIKENNLGLIAEPYVSAPIELAEEDSLLIVASDGLWDVVKGDEAMQIVEGMDSAEDIASCLLQTATSSTLCADNVTVVVACL